MAPKLPVVPLWPAGCSWARAMMRKSISSCFSLLTLAACLGISGVAHAEPLPNLRPGDISYDRETHVLAVEIINDGAAPVGIETVLAVNLDGLSTLFIDVEPVLDVPSVVIEIPEVFLEVGMVTATVDATFRVSTRRNAGMAKSCFGLGSPRMPIMR